MNIETIISDLLKHEISKQEAVNKIRDIMNSYRLRHAMEGNVESVSFTSENNHGVLKILIPYGYEDIKGKIKNGDKIDISLLY